jgi:SpoIID/LytB domain protein
MTGDRDVSSAPVITVGIVSATALEFEFLAPYSPPGASEHFAGPFRAFLDGTTIVVENAAGRHAYPGSASFQPVDPSGGTFLLRDVTIGVAFHWERKEDQRFPGSLRIVAQGGTLTAVNVVSVEDYLASVISSEMSAGSSMHLLKAHAMTSRSWLLAQIDKSRRLKENPVVSGRVVEDGDRRIRWYDREDHALFDVCADDHCQRYQGVTRAFTDAVGRAVRETRGRVLMHSGSICDARFSKSCGGITEPFETVWEPTHYPYLVNVADREAVVSPADVSGEEAAQAWIRSSPEAFCNTTDRKILSQVLLKYDQETTDFFRWKVEYAQDELASLVSRKAGIDFGAILDLVPRERGPSGRLTLLSIIGTKRTLTIGKELEIRRTLSPSHLYSSALVVDKIGAPGAVPSRFTLAGAGWGHGVGLCQIGAAVMGERGYSPETILRHYFPGAEIQPAY